MNQTLKFNLLCGGTITRTINTETSLFDIIKTLEDSNAFIYKIYKQGEEEPLLLQTSLELVSQFTEPLFLLKGEISNELFTLWNNSIKTDTNIHELYYKDSLHLDQKYYSFEPIRQFIQLKSLNIHYTSSYNVCPLIYTDTLVNLEKLEITNCVTISSLTNFKNMPQLKSLSIINGVNILDISDLIHLKQIEYLKLWDCSRLSNIDIIHFLPTLKTINLYHCINIVSIEPFNTLINLQHIYLFKCHRLYNIVPLTNLLNINLLELYSDTHMQQIRDVSAIKSLVNLQYLKLLCNDAIDNNLEQDHILDNLNNLDTIELWNCSHINNIRLPSNIVQLYLHKCTLFSFKTIIHLTKLKVLYIELKNNIIYYPNISEVLYNLEHIDQFKELTSLSLTGLYITDISIIEKLDKLTTLRLNKCNNILSIDFLKRMPSITRVDIVDCISLFVNKDTLSFIYTLENITQLNIIDTTEPV